MDNVAKRDHTLNLARESMPEAIDPQQLEFNHQVLEMLRLLSEDVSRLSASMERQRMRGIQEEGIPTGLPGYDYFDDLDPENPRNIG